MMSDPVYHAPVVQGSDEWLEMRRGIITASEVKLLLTPTLKFSNNEKQRAHLFELAAQRISGFVEPRYVSDDMLRGVEDEILARQAYSENFAPVESCGFITRDMGGFTVGYSPDGLVGADGLIECKSRRQRFQIETIAGGEMPSDFILQVQTGLWVSGRAWVDFISYSAGLPMAVYRIWPSERIIEGIQLACECAEEAISEIVGRYRANLSTIRNVPTERRATEEMTIG